jgi:hemolysin III
MGRHEAPQYTWGEELANCISHGLGALLAVAGLSILVVLASQKGDPWRVASSSVYGATLIFLYLGSTLYHSFRDPRVRAAFRCVDHAGIYLLIAGTYTPFTLVSLRGPWGWTLFGLVWGLAVAGVVLTFFYPGRPRALAAAIYIAMGWLIVIAFKPLVAAIHGGGAALLVAGGLAYTVGAVFYVFRRIPFNHAIFHFFVLGGSICHFFAILYYVVLPSPPG